MQCELLKSPRKTKDNEVQCSNDKVEKVDIEVQCMLLESPK